MAELMRPVAVKIGDTEAVNYQNPDSHDVVVRVGDITSRDAGSHASVLMGQAQVVVSVWDGSKIRAVFVDRHTGEITTQ